MLRSTASVAALLLGTALACSGNSFAVAQDQTQVSIDACSSAPITMNVDVTSTHPVDVDLDVGVCELSLEGDWQVTQECTLDWDGWWNLGPTSAGEFRGTAKFSAALHRLSGYVSGRHVEIRDVYRDIFGQRITETYSGTLSRDGLMIEGEMSGGWANHCSFVAYRD